MPLPTHSSKPQAFVPSLWLRGLLWVVVLATLAAVFTLYLQPEMMRTLADSIWACF